VNKTTFGLLCKISLISAPQQEQAYAQPLIVANGSGGMTAYVATMQDRIYAVSIPANWNGSCSTLATISRNLLDGFPNESAADCNHLGGGGCTIIAPSVGVLGTPVIDTSTGTLYVVAESQSPPFPQTPTAWYHRIHALDVTTLAEKATSSPATIQPAQIGNAIFVSQQLIQRPGLLFLGPAISPTSPTVYVGFSMMDGTTPNPSGWVLAFDGGNLGLGGFPLAYATTSGQADSNNRHGGGAWMGGGGLPAGLDEK
jgi:hypothetical protein